MQLHLSLQRKNRRPARPFHHGRLQEIAEKYARARAILEILEKGYVHYTDLDKKVCATCHSFATTNTFKSQLHYLLSNGYITRVARGIYRLTSKGEKYLVLLAS